MPDTGGFWASTPMQGLLPVGPPVILFVALLVLPGTASAAAARSAARPGPGQLRPLAAGGVLLVAAVVRWPCSFMGPANVIKLGIGLAFGLVCCRWSR